MRLLGVGIAVLWLMAPTSAAAVSGADAVRLLNAQRASAGLPADIVERPDWSAACAQHLYYQHETGTFGHSEDPSSPYYSEAGAWAAGVSVLSWGLGWSYPNPWEQAPIHLFQLLSPALNEMGASEAFGMACATTWPGLNRQRPTELETFSYPGDGARDVPYSEQASEMPFVPGDFAGLPSGTTTGPYLLVFLEGPTGAIEDASVSSAELAGPNGPVDIRVVDSAHPVVGPYMPGAGAFVIPSQPLSPASRYRATVTFSTGAASATRSFFFETSAAKDEPGEAGESGPSQQRPRRPLLKLKPARGGVKIVAGPALVGRWAELVITRWRKRCWRTRTRGRNGTVRHCAAGRSGKRRRQRVKLRRLRTVRLGALRHGVVLVQAHTRPFTFQGQRYADAWDSLVLRRNTRRR